MDKKNILVLASTSDSSTDVFLSQAGDCGCDVKIVTPRQLSQAGWLYRHDDQKDTICVGESATMPACEIDGLITRLVAVSPFDLPYIVDADRSYLAAEMTAFLLAWLSSLQCPLLNRPTPSCLAGPYISQAQSINLAASLGIPVAPCKIAVKPGFETGRQEIRDATRVVIAGDNHLGQVHPRLLHYAKNMARALDVGFVAVDFSGPGPDARFTGLSLWPEITDALAKLMLGQLASGVTDTAARRDVKCA